MEIGGLKSWWFGRYLYEAIYRIKEAKKKKA